MIAPDLGGAWRYRHFIVSSIRAEVRARFIRSKLGAHTRREAAAIAVRHALV